MYALPIKGVGVSFGVDVDADVDAVWQPDPMIIKALARNSILFIFTSRNLLVTWQIYPIPGRRPTV
jgi:hypothetical protein